RQMGRVKEQRSAFPNADPLRGPGAADRRTAKPPWRYYARFMAGPVQSIERAAAILRLLAGGPRRLGLGEVASSLGLAKGTAHGILRTLQHVDFVEQDATTGKYQLGAALLHLGTSYLDVNELRSRSINWA